MAERDDIPGIGGLSIMVTAAWDTSNLVALYYNGVQCETCCAPVCGDCMDAPSGVWVSLANFTDCGCFTWWGDDSRSAEGLGIADGIKGVYYCKQIDPGGIALCITGTCAYQSDSDPENPGVSDYEGGFGTLHSYSLSDDCSGGITFERNFDRLRIEVCLRDGNALVNVHVADSTNPNYPALSAFHMVFNGTITYAEGESCADTEERASNDLDDCVGGVGKNILYGVKDGTVGIWPADPCETALTWVSMGEYDAGDVAIDPIDAECYMANVDSQSVTRPALNADWVLVP